MPPKRICTSASPRFSNVEFYKQLKPNEGPCKSDPSMTPERNTSCLDTDEYLLRSLFFSSKCKNSQLDPRGIALLWDSLPEDEKEDFSFAEFERMLNTDPHDPLLIETVFLKSPKALEKAKLTVDDIKTKKAGLIALRELAGLSIDKKIEDLIINTDPTKGVDPHYAPWIYEHVITTGDEITELLKLYLDTHYKNKSKLPPINQIPGFPELEFIFDTEEYSKFKPKLKLIKGPAPTKKEVEGTIVIHEDSEAIVVSLLNVEAAKYWGRDTKWCTARCDENNMFDRYRKDGELFVVVSKKTPFINKFQLHFETGQYMNISDEPVKISFLRSKFPTVFTEFENTGIVYFIPQVNINNIGKEDIPMQIEDIAKFCKDLRVTSLSINGRPDIFKTRSGGYTHYTIPSSFEDITSLKYLRIIHCKITIVGGIPVNLIELKLYSNNIQGIILENVTNLEYCDLKDNDLRTIEGFPPRLISFFIDSNKGIRYISDKLPTTLKELGISKINYVPMGITDLVNLEYLNMENNKALTAELLGVILRKSVTITELSIQNNPQLLSISDDIGDLYRLERLDISNTGITELSNGISRCKNLEFLIAGSNDITTIPARFFNDLVNLEGLTLNDNKLEVFPDLSKLSLANLGINFNKLSHIKDGYLPRDIENLDISGNLFTKLPNEIINSTTLSRLDCSKNKLVYDIFDIVIPTLEELIISYNKIKRLDGQIFTPALSSFRAANCGIEEIINLDRISKDTPIVTLDLEDNDITNITFPELQTYFQYLNKVE